jgi:HSP20 family protein
MPEFNTPAVNVIETPTEFTMEFGVPGMERSDFDLKVENGLLKLSAEKTTEQNDVDGDFKRREFNYQSFERSFWLPETILTEEIKASYENGILKVVLPKKVEAEKAIQSKIEVN